MALKVLRSLKDLATVGSFAGEELAAGNIGTVRDAATTGALRFSGNLNGRLIGDRNLVAKRHGDRFDKRRGGLGAARVAGRQAVTVAVSLRREGEPIGGRGDGRERSGMSTKLIIVRKGLHVAIVVVAKGRDG